MRSLNIPSHLKSNLPSASFLLAQRYSFRTFTTACYNLVGNGRVKDQIADSCDPVPGINESLTNSVNYDLAGFVRLERTYALVKRVGWPNEAPWKIKKRSIINLTGGNARPTVCSAPVEQLRFVYRIAKHGHQEGE